MGTGHPKKKKQNVKVGIWQEILQIFLLIKSGNVHLINFFIAHDLAKINKFTI